MAKSKKQQQEEAEAKECAIIELRVVAPKGTTIYTAQYDLKFDVNGNGTRYLSFYIVKDGQIACIDEQVALALPGAGQKNGHVTCSMDGSNAIYYLGKEVYGGGVFDGQYVHRCL